MSEKIYPYRHVPNMITCLNLLCGCLSIVSAFSGMTVVAACFIIAAAVFDFFDGFAARLLRAYSPMGKELDSLADMVSFGVAPSSIMYVLLLAATKEYGLPVEIALLAFIIAVFSALRLAKFNIDARQSDAFIGLPTPANALFICSLAFIVADNGRMATLAGHFFFLLAVIALFSYLLVAELPLFSLKFKTFGWKNNQIRYIFVVCSAVLLIIFRRAGLAAIIPAYILLSVFTNRLCNKEDSA